MLHKAKTSAIALFNNPHARTILILGTLIVAALAGGAPHDVGGG